MRSSVGTANCGVPRYTSLTALAPLVRFLQLPYFPSDQVPLQRADVADVQRPIQVIRLMQKRPGKKILTGHLERLPSRVERAHGYFLRPRDGLPKRRQA